MNSRIVLLFDKHKLFNLFDMFSHFKNYNYTNEVLEKKLHI